jgi:hypothetical protein
MQETNRRKRTKVLDLRNASQAEIFECIRLIYSLQNTHVIKIEKIPSKKK